MLARECCFEFVWQPTSQLVEGQCPILGRSGLPSIEDGAFNSPLGSLVLQMCGQGGFITGFNLGNRRLLLIASLLVLVGEPLTPISQCPCAERQRERLCQREPWCTLLSEVGDHVLLHRR